MGAETWCRNETNGSGNVADAPTTRRGMHSDRNGARTTAKTRKTISKTPNKPKMPNSPVGAKIRHIGKADGWGNHVDGLNVCRDTQRTKTDSKTTENANRKVKTCQVRPRRPNSPCRVEIKTVKLPERRKHVSNNGNLARETERSSLDDFLRCWEILRLLRRVLKPRKMAVRMTDVMVTRTALSADDDSNRVAATRLAAQRQQMCNNARTRQNDLPVSPGQPAIP